jgi:hypothetical protein
LLANHSGERGVCGTGSGREVHSSCHEPAANLAEQRTDARIKRAYMSAQNVVPLLSIAAQHGGDRCNADTAAEISHEIEEAGRVSHLLADNQAHCYSRQWHED